MNNKRFGCLAIGLFILLCMSAFLNLILVAVSAKGLKTVRKHNLAPQFEEKVVVNGSSSSSDKIALITLRGLISSSVAGTLGETMVDDLKIALQQAVDDDDVKAIEQKKRCKILKTLKL